MYHGYENGRWTLGRQTLLEPIIWTDDGWFKSAGAELARPIRKPAGDAVPHGFALSDDFTTNKMGIEWGFYGGDVSALPRFRYESHGLWLRAQGTGPADCSPLTAVCGDPRYEVEVEAELLDPKAAAGLLVFYSRRLYAGVGFSAGQLILHRYGVDRPVGPAAGLGSTIHFRLRNDDQVVTMWYGADGRTWTRLDPRIDVSGYHHNVAGEFLSLRPALYASGHGAARFRNFRYRALP